MSRMPHNWLSPSIRVLAVFKSLLIILLAATRRALSSGAGNAQLASIPVSLASGPVGAHHLSAEYLDGLFANTQSSRLRLTGNFSKQSRTLVAFMCFERAELIRTTLTALLASDGIQDVDLLVSQDGDSSYRLDVPIPPPVNSLYIRHPVNLCPGQHHFFVKRFAFDIMGYDNLIVAEEDNTVHPQALKRASSSSAPGPSSPSSKAPKNPAEVRADLVKGCSTILKELQGLDFPRSDVKGYFQFVVKPPAGVAKDFDLQRARAAVEQLIAGKEEAVTDVEGLKAAQLMLSEVWRWRRRGGGMDDETDRPNYVIALESLQNVEPEQIDRITSSLLDNLPMSDAEKREMSGSVQQVAMAGINGAVWGSIVGAGALLLFFNFARGG